MLPQHAARIWRELATGGWRVLAATDQAGVRHLAVTVASAKPVDWARLTSRERRVLSLCSLGVSQKVIAIELRLSPSTVSQVLHVVCIRLGFSRIAHLARAYRASSDGLAPPPASNTTESDDCSTERQLG